jgi:hypothetical protein
MQRTALLASGTPLPPPRGRRRRRRRSRAYFVLERMKKIY